MRSLILSFFLLSTLFLAPLSVQAQEPEAPPPADAAEGAEAVAEEAGTQEAQGEDTEADDSEAEDAEPADLFGDSIQVNVVNVDVYVTDKKGNPILGLTEDDFEIFEDGRPMEISNFYPVENGRPVGEDGVVVQEEVVPGLPQHLQPVEVPEDQRLHLVVFIDHFNIRPFNRNRVMRELRQFLTTKLRPEDRVMLVSYTRSLKIEHPFTSDPRVISGLMTTLEKKTGSATLADSERKQVLEDIDDSDSEWNALARARLYAESLTNDMTFTINALKDFVDSLAGLPGRKAILHVSDGLPMVPGEDVFHYIDNKFKRTVALTEAFTYDLSRRFDQLAAQANANRVTFYMIDAGGLRTYSHIDASNRGGPGRGPFIDTINISNLQNSLHYLSNVTGGTAIVNRNRVLPALEEVSNDLRNYYSLGYTPPHAGDGRLYKLKVKVDIKGAQVRHRESYRDKSVETTMAETTMASLHFDYHDNPLDVKLDFGDPVKRPRDNLYTVPVRVRIPLSKVTLVPRESTHEGRLRVWLSALDDKGRTAPVQEAPVPISIPNDEIDRAREQYYVYTIELLMRSGGQDVAVGLRDDLGADTSFVSRRINVG
ncbi:MAG: VWA domain-containing protein [Acidobacteriota bacterium]|nr:VWA domain-containing protein [Acidobacteriota bacterium]